MDRRDFLKVILAAGIAPAIVRAESIMRINPAGLIVPDELTIEDVLWARELLERGAEQSIGYSMMAILGSNASQSMNKIFMERYGDG